jgi:hypothetical protein
MKIYLVSLLIILILSGGCKSTERISVESFSEDNCISTELKEVIDMYINSTSNFFVESELFYRSIYFFSENNNNYFTIWTFTFFPEHHFKDKNKKFDYFLYHHEKFKIVLIVGKNNKIDLPFRKCKELQKFATLDKKNDNHIGLIYDGSWYPKTYKYVIDQNKIEIEKIDTFKASFLGEEYIEFENRIRNRNH